MALPTTQLIITLFLAHVVVLSILVFCWLFIRHAQKKHHEAMTHSRVKDMPKAEHPDLKEKIFEKPKEPSIVLPTRPKKVEKKVTKNTTRSYEKEWAEVEEELRVLRGDLAPQFSNKSPKPKSQSKEEMITAEQTKLDEVVKSSENENQNEFEKHYKWVRNAIERKGYRDPGQKSYESQIDSIDAALASLDLPNQSSDQKRDLPEPKRGSKKQSHQDWHESVAKDFENLYKMTARQAKRHSWFRKKPDQPFVAMHKAEVENKAIALVQKIARRIEGDHPIPVKELDWIQASLQDVHQDIWKKEKK
ncbi:hypothetical protein CL619_01475 [archaeon]|nr:hypothetical protein [archaeon]|tara:strand:+ start:1593 stop:2507 length:915 start_codon:yes stop_codon:yes gene_type:complete